MEAKHKFQFHKKIYKNIPKIHEEAREAAKEIGLEKLRGKIGLYVGSSGCPGPLPKYACIDEMYRIIEEEFRSFTPSRFRDALTITKSHTYGGIEIDYEQTWKEDEFGIPIFSLEDLFTNTNPIRVST